MSSAKKYPLLLRRRGKRLAVAGAVALFVVAGGCGGGNEQEPPVVDPNLLVFTSTRDGGGVFTLERPLSGSATAVRVGPGGGRLDLSPDGRLIVGSVFTPTPSRRTNIVLSRLDGGDPVWLTTVVQNGVNDGTVNTNPGFSPDGAQPAQRQ